MLYEVGASKTRYILSSGREIAKVIDGTTYYTHRDHLGSSSVVTDSTGKVVNWNANQPYGENWQVSPDGTVDLDKHRFTGKETDTSSGLIYFGARFYDPEVGRFISVDQAKDGDNWYAYCYDNPVKYVDPNGRNPIIIIIQKGIEYIGPETSLVVQRGSQLATRFYNTVVTNAPHLTEVAIKYGDKALDLFVDGFNSLFKQGQGYQSFSALKNALGSPGIDKQWHHIVEQSQISRSGFDVTQINNTKNVKAIDIEVHRKISGYYSSKQPFTEGKTVRDWLAGKSFDEQYKFGLEVIEKF